MDGEHATSSRRRAVSRDTNLRARELRAMCAASQGDSQRHEKLRAFAPVRSFSSFVKHLEVGARLLRASGQSRKTRGPLSR